MGKRRGPHKGLRRRKPKGFRVYDPHYFTPAGPVTVKKPDGTEETEPPLKPRELQKIVKVRGAVSDGQKQKILKRDKGCCRYCGCSVGPFHIDHVVPIVSGGGNKLRNLVLACDTCNQRKGSKTWTPRPIPQGTPNESTGSANRVREPQAKSTFVPRNQRPGAIRDWRAEQGLPRGD